jgi:hypothetical protein
MKRSSSQNLFNEPKAKVRKLERHGSQVLNKVMEKSFPKVAPLAIEVTEENVKYEILEHATQLHEEYERQINLLDRDHQTLLLSLNKQHADHLATLNAAYNIRYQF